MRNLLLTFMLLLTTAFAMYAQNVQVQGVVVSATDNEPLLGVNVVEKGTTNGTVTGLDGDFTLSVPAGSTLVISYVGFKAKEVVANASAPMNIVLQEDSELLDEVVVVGYGVQKKSVVTAAISRVSSEDLETVTPTRIEDVLKGKVSGVQIMANSGQPNAESKVRIRGIGTINDSKPLFIVDGMPVDGGISYLNPTDIESVEVLKDAASAAIYGTRGANGVILVTTKGGTTGKATVNYDFSIGWQNPWKKKAILNAQEYMYLQNEMAINDNGTPRYSAADIAGAQTTDWQDETFNYDAPVQSHQLSVSGGTEKATYFLSFGYLNHEGIVGGNVGKSNYERYSIRLNNTYTAYESKERNFLNKVKVGTNIGYTRGVSSSIEANSEWGSILGSAITFDPSVPLYASDADAAQILADHPFAVTDKNGRVYSIPPSGFQEIANPVGMLHQPNSSVLNEDKFVASFWGEIDILPGLTFRSSYGADLAFWGTDTYDFPYFLSVQGKDLTELNSGVSSEMNRGFTWQVENYFSYNKTFNEKHNIGVILGQSAQKATSRFLKGEAKQPEVYDPNKAYIDNTIGSVDLQRAYGNVGDANFRSLASYFGRVNYNYDERYMIQASLRRDGSSRFGSNNKWAMFPAVSVGWNVLNEPYITDYKPSWFDVLKLRVSWGKNGNDRIGDLRYAAFNDKGQNYFFGGGYKVSDDSFGGMESNGVSPAALANNNLKWEESEQIDLGFDTRFLNSALTFSFDYFKKKTNGMLMDVAIPKYVGQGAPVGNVGDMENWGLEFEASWKQSVKDFNYYVSANASYMKNKLVHLGNASGIKPNIENNGASGVGEYVRGSNGEVYPYFYGLKTDGLFQNQAEIDAYRNADGGLIQPAAKPGDVRFIDLNNDGQINDDDKTKIGKGMPDWTYGFSLGASYKGFDASVFFQGTIGNDVFEFAQRGDVPRMNRPEWILQRWHGEGTSNRIPRMTSANENQNWRSSDLYVKDGSYLRLKNAQIGYTLPSALTRMASIQRLRVFVAGENLLTFTGYDGFDPEISDGIDKGIYPQSRTVSVGLNVTF